MAVQWDKVQTLSDILCSVLFLSSNDLSFCAPETWLGGGSKMHQQEEPSQISDSAGEGDQNTEGKSSSERDKRTPPA